MVWLPRLSFFFFSSGGVFMVLRRLGLAACCAMMVALVSAAGARAAEGDDARIAALLGLSDARIKAVVEANQVWTGVDGVWTGSGSYAPLSNTSNQQTT